MPSEEPCRVQRIACLLCKSEFWATWEWCTDCCKPKKNPGLIKKVCRLLHYPSNFQRIKQTNDHTPYFSICTSPLPAKWEGLKKVQWRTISVDRNPLYMIWGLKTRKIRTHHLPHAAVKNPVALPNFPTSVLSGYDPCPQPLGAPWKLRSSCDPHLFEAASYGLDVTFSTSV